MTELQRNIIQQLIWGACTAQDLALVLRADRQLIIDTLEEMAVTSEVRPVFPAAPGDAVCERCGAELAGVEPGERCPTTFAGGELTCGGFLRDECRWVYCGGPISKVLEAA